MKATFAAALVAVAVAAPAHAERATPQPAWPELVTDVFADRPMVADGLISLEAPERAHDAALVPMTIRTHLPEDDARHVERITLVIDENPAPVAATFEIGPDAGVTAISTRVRVDSYTPVHAVAELSDGSLHVAERFVKAAGGCSAPIAKNSEEAIANIGKMKLRQFAPDGPQGRPEMQVMLRHPNTTGLQKDPLTQYPIPARFIYDLAVSQGDETLLRVEGGISISEDPNIRFDFDAEPGETITVKATDTDGAAFEDAWEVEVPAGAS